MLRPPKLAIGTGANLHLWPRASDEKSCAERANSAQSVT